MTRKISKILFVLGIIGLIVGFIFVLQDNGNSDKKDNKKPNNPTEDITDKKLEEIKTEKVVENELNSFVKLIFDSNVTKDNIEKITKFPIDDVYVFYGKDSYFRTLLKVKTTTDISDYQKASNTYIEQLDKIIKDNFEFNVNEYIVSAEGDIVQNVSYKSYYFVKFVDDFSSVNSKLLEYLDLNIDEILVREPTQEEALQLYKLNVKTLEIMSDYFNDYINKDETKDYQLIYKKSGNTISDDYLSLYINFAGMFYNKGANEDQERNNRVTKIINDAIKNGKLDINNPYKLNS